MGGGISATLCAMVITYAAGLLTSVSGALGEAWTHVTPGQAALAIGLLTYATHNLPKLARWARSRRRRGKAPDAPDAR